MDKVHVTGNTEDYEDDYDMPGEMLETTLSDIPRRKELIVAPSVKVGEVIEELNRRSIGCALIVEEGNLVGIFTERDVLRRVAGTSMDVNAIIVREVMTPSPDTLPENATVAFALNLMSVEGYRHVPIVDSSGSAQGVIGMRDVINWMVDLFPDRVLNVPPQPASFPTTPFGA